MTAIQPAPEIPIDRMLLTTEQAAKVLSIGRTTIWELIRAGELRTVHIGRSCRISHSELKRYVRVLETRCIVGSIIEAEPEEMNGHA